MKNKIIWFLMFVLIVALLVTAISFYLNDKYNKRLSLSQPQNNSTYEKQAHLQADYKSIMKSDVPVYHEIDDYLKMNHFNGTIALFHNGKLEMSKGYGYQDFMANKPATPNTMYLIGSAQKLTTGIMLKKLEIEGKININDPVTKYLPWFKTDKPLLVRDLMLHQSGLQKFEPKAGVHGIDGAVHMLQQQGIQPNKFRIHEYNDANYIVIAKIIEAVSKESYEKFFNDHLLTPYHLDRTAFYNSKAFKSYMATGYDEQKKIQKPHFLDQFYGAGNIYMAPQDMGQLILDLQQYKIIPQKEADPMLYEVFSNRYPSSYRYGFYTYGVGSRTNGIFYGQQFTCYFNKEYVLVMGTNFQPAIGQNEVYMKEIFMHYLKQKDPTMFRM